MYVVKSSTKKHSKKYQGKKYDSFKIFLITFDCVNTQNKHAAQNRARSLKDVLLLGPRDKRAKSVLHEQRSRLLPRRRRRCLLLLLVSNGRKKSTSRDTYLELENILLLLLLLLLLWISLL